MNDVSTRAQASTDLFFRLLLERLDDTLVTQHIYRLARIDAIDQVSGTTSIAKKRREESILSLQLDV